MIIFSLAPLQIPITNQMVIDYYYLNLITSSMMVAVEMMVN